MPEGRSLTDAQVMCLTTAGACHALPGDGGGPNGPGGSGLVRYQAWEPAPGAASDPKPPPGRSVAQQMQCGVGAFAEACDALAQSLISSRETVGVAQTTGWGPADRAGAAGLENARGPVGSAFLRFAAAYVNRLAEDQWDFLFGPTEDGARPWALAQLEFGDFLRPAATSLALFGVGAILDNTADRTQHGSGAGGWERIQVWEGAGRDPMRLTVYAAPRQPDGKWGRLTPSVAGQLVQSAAWAMGGKSGNPVTIGFVSAVIAAAAYRDRAIFFTLQFPL